MVQVLNSLRIIATSSKSVALNRGTISEPKQRTHGYTSQLVERNMEMGGGRDSAAGTLALANATPAAPVALYSPPAGTHSSHSSLQSMALRQYVRSTCVVLVCVIFCGLQIQADAYAHSDPVLGSKRILQSQETSPSSSSIGEDDWASTASQSVQVHNHNDAPTQQAPDDNDTPTAMIIILAVVGAVVLVAIAGVAFIKRHNRKTLDRMSSCELGIESVEEINYWRQ